MTSFLALRASVCVFSVVSNFPGIRCYRWPAAERPLLLDSLLFASSYSDPRLQRVTAVSNSASWPNGLRTLLTSRPPEPTSRHVMVAGHHPCSPRISTCVPISMTACPASLAVASTRSRSAAPPAAPRAAAARSVGRTPRHPRGRQPLTVSTAASIGGGARPVVPRPPGVLVRRPSVDALAPALHQRRRRCPRRRVRDSGPPIPGRPSLTPLDAAEMQNPKLPYPPDPPSGRVHPPSNIRNP